MNTSTVGIGTHQQDRLALGRVMLGVGVAVGGIIALASGDFLPGQPVAKDVAGRVGFAYAAGFLLLASGAAVAWRRTAVMGAAAIALYYFVAVTLVMNGRAVLAHPAEFGAYSGAAEQLAIAAGGLMVYAGRMRSNRAASRHLVRSGEIVFGLCVVLFGVAHFVYMDLTTPLVPRWIPPSPEFWAVATGIAQIAAGVAFLTGVKARLAAVLLAALYLCFALLVHAPMLAAHPRSPWIWSENALNFTLLGVAWIVACRPRAETRGRSDKG